MSGHAQLNTLGIYLSIIQCTVRLSHVQSREGRGRYLGWVWDEEEKRLKITGRILQTFSLRAENDGQAERRRNFHAYFSSLLLSLRRADMNVTLVLVVGTQKVIVQRSWHWLKHKQSAELVNLLVVLLKFKSIPSARKWSAKNLVKFCLIVISWGRRSN